MTRNQQKAPTVAEIVDKFTISDESLMNLKTCIIKEMEMGLSDKENAIVKMLITYVRELSKGDETGLYLALDLGGTHFRVLLVNMNEGQAKVTSAIHDIPEELLTTQNGQDLFDYIALKLLEFVQKYKLKRRRISLGFTFSFPCKQYGLTQSFLVKWTKGFNVGGIIGTDVVRQLKDALKRQLAGLVEAYIDVVAVINDTTGTLVACANTNRACMIGLIVGTGCNACYIERLENCEKWPANYTNPKQVIINCEWGAFGDHKERRDLDKLRNEFDVAIDNSSINPGSQTYEKMISGLYIGEMLRLSLVKLYKSKCIFAKMYEELDGNDQKSLSKSSSRRKSVISVSSTSINQTSKSGSNDQNPHKLFVKDTLNGRHISMLAKDELNGNFEETTKIMQELNITGYTQQDMAAMVQISAAIISRSAGLVAAGVSALLNRIKRPFTVIGYDGSVIKHHPYFLNKLVEKCTKLTPKDNKFEFLQSSDGSGIGAAVVAAALHKERRPIYIVKPGKVYEMHYQRAQQSVLSSETEVSHKVETNNQNK